MARPGITFTDVVKAAQTVLEQGQEPTIDRVRDELGTGSKSTIAPHLKRWRSEYQQQTAWDTIPDELAIAAKAVFEKSQRLAQNQIDDLKAAHAKAIENLTQQLNTLDRECSDKTQRLADATNTCQNLEAEKQSLLIDNQSLREHLTERQHEVRSADQTIEQLQEQLKIAQAEKRDLLKQFEHYQATMADERQTERRSFEIQTQKWEALREEQRQELENLRRDLALKTADHQRMSDENAELKKEFSTTQQHATQLFAKNQIIAEANELLKAEHQSLSKTVLELTAKLSIAKTLEQQTHKELKSLQQLITVQ